MSEHLRMSWRPTDEEIYVWGDGWARGTSAPGSVITTHENRASETRRLGHPTPLSRSTCFKPLWVNDVV